MNYYEHHIGDYAEATAHLTLLEDAVYSRLLRKYYATEQPLPADKKKLARWVGAVGNKDALAALDAVLDDFFTLKEDGYHQARCDAEIGAFRDGEPERELKKQNEKNRMDNHRKERARLFKVLTDAGGHAAWNIGIGELRALVKSVAGSKAQPPETQPATAPATPATATQYPLPNTQYPINQGERVEHQQRGVSVVGPDGPARALVAAQAMQEAGLTDVSATHPKLVLLVEAGVTTDELREAAKAAVKGGKGFPWALARAEGQRRDAAQVGVLPIATAAADPDSREAIETDGERLGIGRWVEFDAATGIATAWPVYRARVVKARLAERGEAVS